MEYDNYSEGAYCDNCDQCSPDEEWATVPVSDLYMCFVCPNCGHIHPKLVISDYGYDLQEYLLFGSNHDEALGMIVWCY